MLGILCYLKYHKKLVWPFLETLIYFNCVHCTVGLDEFSCKKVLGSEDSNSNYTEMCPFIVFSTVDKFDTAFSRAFFCSRPVKTQRAKISRPSKSGFFSQILRKR